MFKWVNKIRYSEVDEHKQLNCSGIINYFQDCSSFQSTSIGKGLAHLEQEQYNWILNAWQICIHRYPEYLEEISISTWPYGFNGIYGYRNFLIEDSKGSVCVSANSIWILVDSNIKPLKVCENHKSGYDLEPMYPMEYAPRKIRIQNERINYNSFPVLRSQIDSNHHVNNSHYVKMALEYIPDNFIISQVRTEYRQAAILGDIIFPSCSISDNICTISLCDSNNNPFAIIEFQSDNTTNN